MVEHLPQHQVVASEAVTTQQQHIHPTFEQHHQVIGRALGFLKGLVGHMFLIAVGMN